MPWPEVSIVDQRREFVMLASLEGANVAALCARPLKWIPGSRSLTLAWPG